MFAKIKNKFNSRKLIDIKYYYLFYFAANFLIAFILLRGGFNPNISPTNNFLSILLASLGDFGIILLVFIVINLLCRKDKTKVRSLNIASFVFLIFILFLHCFSTLFSTFFSYTQLVSFKNPSQGKLIGTYIVYFLRIFTQWYCLLPILIFISICVFSLFINKKENKVYKLKSKFVVLSISILCMLIPMFIVSANTSNTYNDMSMNAVYGANNVGAYNYYVYSIKDLIRKDYDLSNEQKDQMNKFLEEHRYFLSDSNPYAKSFEDKNLIILQLEAINNLVIGLEVDGELIAPNLTRLAKEGVYYSRFYSTAGMGNTSDCEFSSNVGLYPNGNDLSIFELDRENFQTIAKEFKKKDYYTLSIHGNDGGFYNRNNQHISLFGFDEHVDKMDLLLRNPNLELMKDWISDGALLDESINIYKEIDSSFFSYNILVTSHAPFGICEGIEKYNNKNLTSLANAYVSNVKYVDKCVGEYIDKLKEEGLYDNSLIMIYGDHTSTLLRGDAESLTLKNYSDVEFRMEMQNVPFIVLGNGLEVYEDKTVHSNIDIFPTVCALFNLNPQYKFGVDMFSSEESFAYSPRSLDLIFDDYTIMIPSRKIYKINDVNISNKDKKNIVNAFNEFKYMNDLLVASDYFK